VAKGLLAVTSLAAITLAPIPAQAISFTIGSSNSTKTVSLKGFTGQSFTPNVGGNAADANFTIVSGSNPSQVYLTNFTFTEFGGTAPALLNIYSDSGRSTLVTSSISNSGFSYTFDGLTALTFGTQYFAFYPSDSSVTASFDNFSYSGGALYNGGGVREADAKFTATLSDTSATAVPFEFEATGAVVILGGLWGLKRLANKKRQG
jgi:hypothetical protein